MKSSPILVIVLALVSFSLPACNTHQETHSKNKIVVTSPQVKSITITQQYVSQIVAQKHVKVRAFEKGFLEAISVREGQQIKQGDLMFKVVPVHYNSKLDIEVAEAQIAQLEFENTRKKLEEKVVSEHEVAIFEAKLKKSQAKVKQAEAELNFVTVKAPFDGIVGRIHHPQGSLVPEGEILTTLSDDSEMRAYFNVSESRYLEYMAERNQHQDLPIELVLEDGNKFPHVGKIGAIEAGFNTKTGSIPFRADFPNPDRVLHHGQAGKVLIHRVVNHAMVIPQRATFELLDKRYVYVVDNQNVTHQREIVIENELEDLFVVKSGLDLDDKIVVEGFRQVRDGETVEYEDRQANQVVAKTKHQAD